MAPKTAEKLGRITKIDPKNAKNPTKRRDFDMEAIERLSHQVAIIQKRHAKRVARNG